MKNVFELAWEVNVTAFMPYTSMVTNRFIEIEYDHNDNIDKFGHHLIEEAKHAGIQAYVDNKTVFELTSREDGKKLYVGFYDGKLSIGADYHCEHPEQIKRR